MKGQALKPDFFMSNMPTMADEEAKKRGATEDERQLYRLSMTYGWRVLEEYINNIIDDLDNINNQAIEKGATFDVIGQNAVVINLAKTLMRRVITKVYDAKEACEEPKTGK